MTPQHRLPSSIVSILEDGIRCAGLENSCFDEFNKDPIQVTIGGKTTQHASVTDFIRDRVRIHHASWVIGAMQQVLDWSMSEKDDNEWGLFDKLNARLPHPNVLEEAAQRIREQEIELHSLREFKAKITKASKDLSDE